MSQVQMSAEYCDDSSRVVNGIDRAIEVDGWISTGGADKSYKCKVSTGGADESNKCKVWKSKGRLEMKQVMTKERCTIIEMRCMNQVKRW